MNETENTPVVPEAMTPVVPEAMTAVVPETPVSPVVEKPVKQAPVDEKSLLLQRARLMGIKFSNNISVEKLKAKIDEHMKAEENAESEPQAPVIVNAPAQFIPPEMTKQALPNQPETRQQIRDRLVREKMKLVRLRITNLDPKKKNIPGEIFTVANKYIGTVRKYIPFGEATENGYHVPYCIYEMLKARKFLHIRTVKAKHGRGERVETSYVPEFALEVLPNLTEKELKELARMQAAKKGSED
jgi:hypothetical protein